MICPASPYSTLPDDQLVKLQAMVSKQDKELMITILPDRGLYTFALATFIKRTADFIRLHDLDYLNDADQRALINFIAGTDDGLRQHAVTRTPGQADARNESGRSEGVRQAAADVTNEPASISRRRKKG